MHEHESNYFSEFLAEFQKESDRGAALVGAALLDARLERILRSHFIVGKSANELLDGGNGPLASFSARIKCCQALGLITDNEKNDIDLVRAIRNAFAHQEHGLNFESVKIKGLCSSLVSRRPKSIQEKIEYTARNRFIDAVVFNCLQLWYRPEHALQLKCEEHTWPY
jgi:mannitol operon repressor